MKLNISTLPFDVSLQNVSPQPELCLTSSIPVCMWPDINCERVIHSPERLAGA